MNRLALHCRWLLLCGLLLLLGSCGEVAMIEFGYSDNAPTAREVIRKNYRTPPLNRAELVELIGMAIYTGRPEFYGDMIIDEHAREHRSKPVVFSHRSHRTRYACSVCHIELEFSLVQGETGITREDYLEGRYCGACHNGKRAFSTEFACDACHLDLDPNNPSYLPRGEDLETMELPKVSYGDGIDWVKALAQGQISPQRTLYPDVEYPSMPLPEHLLEPLLWTTAAPNLLVSFPHVEHVQWLDCSNCHPDLFSIKQTGTVEFNKEANLYGQFCGSCHMNVALPMNGCSRCHPRLKDHQLIDF